MRAVRSRKIDVNNTPSENREGSRTMQFVSAFLLFLVLAAANSSVSQAESASKNYVPFEQYGGLVLSRTDILPSRQTVPKAQRSGVEIGADPAKDFQSLPSVRWHLRGIVNDTVYTFAFSPAFRWFRPLLRAPPHP